ncbi:hypothetical protein GO292_04914 [Ralstonia solanacearum]|nr:hypothetical protein [Ralstonia solanacearum]
MCHGVAHGGWLYRRRDPVEVAGRTPPGEEDGRIGVRQRAGCEDHRAGHIVQRPGPERRIAAANRAVTLVTQVIPLALRHVGHDQRPRFGRRRQGEGVGVAAVLLGDGDRGGIRHAGGGARRPETDLEIPAVSRRAVLEGHQAPGVVDRADGARAGLELARRIGERVAATRDAQAARHQRVAQVEVAAAGDLAVGRVGQHAAAALQQRHRLAGGVQVHQRRLRLRGRHQLPEEPRHLHAQVPHPRLGHGGGDAVVDRGVGDDRVAHRGLGRDVVPVGRRRPLKITAQRIGDLAGRHDRRELDGAAAFADGEFALGCGDPRDPHVLLGLGRFGFVLHQHKRLPDAWQGVGRLQQQRDSTLAGELPLQQLAGPFDAAREVSLDAVLSGIAPVGPRLGGEQRD